MPYGRGRQSTPSLALRFESGALGAAPDDDWRAVAWADSLGIFAAVGNGFFGASTPMTSADGKIWAANPGPAPSSRWRDVAWNGTLFCAVGAVPSIMTSPDGVNWTLQVTPPAIAGNQLNKVVWADSLGLWVAAGGVVANVVIITSPDGVNWTVRVNAVVAFMGAGVTGLNWSPDLALLCAVQPGAAPNIATSPDGINWTAHATPAGTGAPIAVAWSPNASIFAAPCLGGAGTDKMLTSGDGTVWTRQNVPVSGHANDFFYNSIIWNPTLAQFMVLANNLMTPFKRLYNSLDGVNWFMNISSRNLVQDQPWSGLAWAPILNRAAVVAATGGSRFAGFIEAP